VYAFGYIYRTKHIPDELIIIVLIIIILIESSIFNDYYYLHPAVNLLTL